MNRRFIVLVFAVFLVLVAGLIFRGCGNRKIDYKLVVGDLTPERIRPDILAFIKTRYPNSPEIQKALIQLAQTCQQVLDQATKFDVKGKAPFEPAHLIEQAMRRAEACLKSYISIDEFVFLILETEKRTYDTKERSRINLKFNGALSGSVLHPLQPDRTLCE